MKAEARDNGGDIGRKVAILLVFLVAGKLVGAGKEIAIAYRWGTDPIVDAYVLAQSLATWLPAVWMSVLTSVLIPLLLSPNQDRAEADRELKNFQGELFGLTLLSAAVLVLGQGLLFWMLLRGDLFGLPPRIASHAATFSLYLAPIAGMAVITALVSVRLMAKGKQVNTLLEAVPALCILSSVLLAAPGSSEALVIGTLVGYALHTALACRLVAKTEGLGQPLLKISSPIWKQFAAGLGVMLIGQLVMSSTTLVDQFFVGGLGEGEISALSYANRLLSLFTAIGATAIGRAVLPAVSARLAEGRDHAALQITRRWVLFAIAGGMCVAAMAWLAAPHLVSLVFERGRFDAADTEVVSSLLRYGVVQIPPFFAAIVLVQYLAARRRHRLIAAAAILNVAVKLLANALFVERLGPAGVLLGSAAMYATSAFVLGMAVIFAPETDDE